MRIATVTLHNFRSIVDGTASIGGYALLVGANNTGKSNFVDALRVFYEKGIKFDTNRDFPKCGTRDEESWIDIEFALSDAEYASLKEEYRRRGHRAKVRKYLRTGATGTDGKPKLGIYAYIGDQISDEHFYGAKNVQQGKLGEIIYIPALSRLDEQTKLTGPSALRDMLGGLVKKLAGSSPAFGQLKDAFEGFSSAFRNEQTDDGRSLSGLEDDINAEIDDWEAQFGFDINPASESDILKNLISFAIEDRVLGARLEAEQFGQGFQRHLVYALIRLAAKYQPSTLPGTRREFSASMTLLLYEEPEAFFHPTQQIILGHSLRAIASTEGNQVLISTHSPTFVSHNADDIPSIIRLCRDGGKTVVGQVSAADLTRIFTDNQQVNDLLKGRAQAVDPEDLKQDMEAIKYFLWLDSHRCGMFFARQVLLVEGPSERVLINYLLDTGAVDTPKGGVFVLDCLGKYNIHRFMNLLGPLCITHSVLFDADSSQSPHPELRKLICSCRNGHTRHVECLDPDLETFLGIDKARQPHRKPQHVMLALKEGKIVPERLAALVSLLDNLVRV